MVDNLKVKCEQMDIKLRYNYNKRKLLSAGFKNEQPIIRAHRIFRRASADVASAVVAYYTKKSAVKKNYKSIINYIEKNSQVNEYKVFPPDDAMLELYIKKDQVTSVKSGQAAIQDAISASDTMDTPKTNGDAAAAVEMQMKEAQVMYILRTDFWGNESSLKPEDYINDASDDFIQLDIVIERR